MKRCSRSDNVGDSAPLLPLTSRGKRVVILVKFQLLKSAKEIIEDLQYELGVQAPSKATVCKYTQRFRSGPYGLDDE